MKIGIKVGSKLLTDGNGNIHLLFIQKLCDQIAALKKDGNNTILVSSGAIACDPNRFRSERQRASIGQHRLMAKYDYFMREVHGVDVSQQLVTYHDLEERNGEFANDIREDMKSDFLPIYNYNDAVDNKEIEALHDYADNDKLFLQLCLLAKVDIAIIVSYLEYFVGQDGCPVFNAKPKDKNNLFSCCLEGNSLGYGKDGMKTKIGVLCTLAENNIRAVLAPGLKDNFILNSVQNASDFGLEIKL